MSELGIVDSLKKLKILEKIFRPRTINHQAAVLWSYESMIAQEKVIVIDVDGTLAGKRQAGQSYADVNALPSVVQRIRSLKKEGYWIILHTSRNMRTYDGNIGRIMRHTAPVLVEWLARHEIPYDELHFGKPWCGHDGFYVDDRAIRPREFVTLKPEEIEAIFRRDRLSDE
jgi:capsule biosynthesis phosphatase